MKRGLKAFCFVGLLLGTYSVFVNTAFADATIGNGFSCSGSSILKGDKEIPYAKARSTVAKTLEKLKSKLETAKTKKQKAAIKAAIKAANNSKTLLKACSSGQLSDDQVDPVFTQLAAGSGSYSGNYNGTVNGFLPLSGEVNFQMTLDGTVFGALLTLGGNLGSALDAQPLSFSADVGGVAFPAQFNLPDTFLGSVTLSVTQDGHLTITNTGSSNSSVTLDGQFTNQTITGTINGTYSGQTFTGNFSLTRS